MTDSKAADAGGTDAGAFLAAIVASSDDAIVGKSLDGTILSWNGAAERIFGYAAQEIIGKSIRTLIPPDRQAEEDAIIASVSRGERVPTFETIRLRKDGTTVPIAVTVSPVRDGEGRIVAASKIARDITSIKHVRAQLDDSEERFRLLADNMSQLAWIADETGSISWYNRRWFDFTGTTLEQMLGWGWTKVHHPDHLDRVTRRWEANIASGEEWEDTFPLRGANGEYRWFLSRALPIRDVAGHVGHWFGTNTDITEMRDAEQRIELLMMEVNHRSKNMLAVIQALARRTAAQGGDFVSRLERRIQAIALNQDLLVHRAWSSVPIDEMVTTQLSVIGDSALQVALEGPELLLTPGAVEAIAMAIHEMATNAVRHGALNSRAGQVVVAWRVEPAQDGEQFAITWTETGGPPVVAPEALGFGARIIADVPRNKLGAEVSIDFPPEGFRWSLRCPVATISQQPASFGGDTPVQFASHPG
ncbi:MAG: PAS domain S-box protein [Novosphingobium sp.]